MEISAGQTPTALKVRRMAMRLLLCVFMFAPLAHPTPTAHAQDVASPPNTGPLSTNPLKYRLRVRGDLTLTDTTLRQALFTISRTWKINIVVGDAVDGSVNGVFKDAPLNDILDALLLANGYGYRQVGQSLVVMPIEKTGETNPLFETATIRLQRVDATEALAGAKMLVSPQGKVHPIPSANSVLVVDFPDRVERVRKFLKALDDATSDVTAGTARIVAAQFSPQYIRAEDLQQSLQSLLSPLGKVTTIASENRVVIVDSPEVIARVRDIINQIDVPRRQVRITALVYDMSIEDVETLGVNWKHAAKARPDASGSPRSLFAFDSLMQAPAAAGSPAGVMTFMNLSSSFDLTSVIDAMNTASDSRLLADPTIMVVDREQATIQIVQEIPYQQLTQTGLGGNIGTTAFREAGVTLNVTPRISNDATIQIDVTPTFSILTGFTTSASPQPIIDKRETHTIVRVADRQTLVIGGLRQRSEIVTRRGIPKLKDIRNFGFGKLFRSHKTSIRESELVVFLHCEIVGPCTADPPRQIAAHEHSRYLLDTMPVAGEGRLDPPASCRVELEGAPSVGQFIPQADDSLQLLEPEIVEPAEDAALPIPPQVESAPEPRLAPNPPLASLRRLPRVGHADKHMADKPQTPAAANRSRSSDSPLGRRRTYPPTPARRPPPGTRQAQNAGSKKPSAAAAPKAAWYKRLFPF